MTKEEMEIERKVRMFMAYIPERAKVSQLRKIIELLEKDRLKLRLELDKHRTSTIDTLMESSQVFNKIEGILVDC